MPKTPLGLRKATRKTGKERVRSGDQHLDGDLLDFWGWTTSDILSNATRGVLAEYIVAQAVEINTKEEVRDEWAAFDLQMPSGITIEVSELHRTVGEAGKWTCGSFYRMAGGGVTGEKPRFRRSPLRAGGAKPVSANSSCTRP